MTRGPVPKRSTERRRTNKESAPTVAPSFSDSAAAPDADAEWHPIARDWFASLAESAQSQFYEPSDWAQARYIAHEMSRSLNAPRFSGQALAALTSAMTELLTTEGARRRARVELERNSEESKPSGVTAIDDYRSKILG